MTVKNNVLSEEQIASDFDSVYALIESIKNEKRKNQLTFFFEQIGENYFSAPASSRADYHDSCVGGLANHSLQVLKNFNAICKLWGQDISKDSIITCALTHDSGKAETVDKKPIYLEETEKWKLNKGVVYYYNPDIRDGLTHAQRSVRLLSHYGVELTNDEYLAILAHDFLFVDENIVFKTKLNRLGYLLHFADVWTVMGRK